MADDLIREPFNARKIKRELELKSPREGDILKEYFHNREIKLLRNSFIDLDTVIELRKRIGGQLILCHPAKHGYVGRGYYSAIFPGSEEPIVPTVLNRTVRLTRRAR